MGSLRGPSGAFARHVVLLTGGTAVGQLLLVLIAPMLTRLYEPTEFGIFSVFISLNGIIGMIMALRYEFGVPTAPDEHRAASMVIVAVLIVLVMTIIAMFVVAMSDNAIWRWFNVSELPAVRWLLVLTLCTTGLAQPLDYWTIRRKKVALNAGSRIVLFWGQALSQLGLGLLGIGVLGLVLGYVAGYVGRLLWLLGGLSKEDWRLLRGVDWRMLPEVARSERRFLIYAVPSSVLQGVTNFLPPILIAVYYEPTVAGLFGLAHRVLILPTRLIAAAASQVFLDEAARLDREALRKFLDWTVLRFAGIGLLVMGPVLLAGPWLFATVFGEQWREAGAVGQLLAVPQLVRFVLIPVSQTFNVVNRMDMDVLTALAGSGALGVAFVLAGWFSWSPMVTIGVYAFGTAGSQILALALARSVTGEGKAMERNGSTSK